MSSPSENAASLRPHYRAPLGIAVQGQHQQRTTSVPGLLRLSLLAAGRGKVFICDMSSLLGEVVGSFEIPAEEPDLAVDIPL